MEYTILLKMQISCNVSKLFAMPFERCYGVMHETNHLKLVYYGPKSKGKVGEFNFELESESKPFVHTDGSIITGTKTGVDVHKLVFDKKDVVTSLIISFEFEGTTVAVCKNGQVISVAVGNQNTYAFFN